jgi:anti-anti-sigma factor
MLPAGTLFEIERVGQTVVLTPVADLREMEYQRIETSAEDVFRLLRTGPSKNVVIDFSRTDSYGSTALGFFARLWRRVCDRGGRMAFCNVSAHEREVLRVTRLDGLWPICPSRQEAMKAVEG